MRWANRQKTKDPFPLTNEQRRIRQSEAALLHEIAESGGDIEAASNWFYSRWAIDYTEVNPRQEPLRGG